MDKVITPEPWEAGERWDTEDVDRVEVTVWAGLPAWLVTTSWLDMTDSQRRKLRKVIDEMPNKDLKLEG